MMDPYKLIFQCAFKREWKKAQDHGHHGESSQRTSAVFASWWWWWFKDPLGFAIDPLQLHACKKSATSWHVRMLYSWLVVYRTSRTSGDYALLYRPTLRSLLFMCRW